MKKQSALLFSVLLIGLLHFNLYGQDAKTIPSMEAKQHIGDTLWVSGKVAQATINNQSKGAPAYLNFDEVYPNHNFTVVVWTESYPEFTESKVKSFEGKVVRVYGVVKEYRGKPQIVYGEGVELSIVD